jgi:hypothetical protein
MRWRFGAEDELNPPNAEPMPLIESVDDGEWADDARLESALTAAFIAAA